MLEYELFFSEDVFLFLFDILFLVKKGDSILEEWPELCRVALCNEAMGGGGG